MDISHLRLLNCDEDICTLPCFLPQLHLNPIATFTIHAWLPLKKKSQRHSRFFYHCPFLLSPNHRYPYCPTHETLAWWPLCSFICHTSGVYCTNDPFLVRIFCHHFFSAAVAQQHKLDHWWIIEANIARGLPITSVWRTFCDFYSLLLLLWNFHTFKYLFIIFVHYHHLPLTPLLLLPHGPPTPMCSFVSNGAVQLAVPVWAWLCSHPDFWYFNS